MVSRSSTERIRSNRFSLYHLKTCRSRPSAAAKKRHGLEDVSSGARDHARAYLPEISTSTSSTPPTNLEFDVRGWATESSNEREDGFLENTLRFTSGLSEGWHFWYGRGLLLDVVFDTLRGYHGISSQQIVEVLQTKCPAFFPIAGSSSPHSLVTESHGRFPTPPSRRHLTEVLSQSLVEHPQQVHSGPCSRGGGCGPTGEPSGCATRTGQRLKELDAVGVVSVQNVRGARAVFQQ